MFTLPAGKYYLGDPCYTLGGDKWLDVLKQSDYFDKPYVKGKKMAVAFGTAYGDGQYMDQYGNEYPVDAGMIGLVPVSMATIKKPTGVHMFTFTEPIECEDRGDGVLYFGGYAIDTDPDDEEEEEEDGYCSHCGRG
jgi:hypothetical protein